MFSIKSSVGCTPVLVTLNPTNCTVSSANWNFLGLKIMPLEEQRDRNSHILKKFSSMLLS